MIQTSSRRRWAGLVALVVYLSVLSSLSVAQAEEAPAPKWYELLLPTEKLTPEQFPTVEIVRAGKRLSFPSFAAAVKASQSKDRIFLKAGVHPIREEIVLPAKVSELLIVGEGPRSVLQFERVQGVKGSSLETTAPLTFRDLTILTPVFKSANASARFWFESAYVVGEMIYYGGERFVGTTGQVFILGGFSNRNSSFGGQKGNEYVRREWPRYFFTLVHSPGMAKSEDGTYFRLHSLQELSQGAGYAPALTELEKELKKQGVSGANPEVSKELAEKVIRELALLSRAEKLKMNPGYGTAEMRYGEQAVAIEALNRLSAYLQEKHQISPEKQEHPQLAEAIQKVKAYGDRAPLLSLYLLGRFDPAPGTPHYAEYKKLVADHSRVVGAQQGCAVNVTAKPGAKLSPAYFRPHALESKGREGVVSIYPAAVITDPSARSCRMDVTVSRYLVSSHESVQSTQVTTEQVETDQARRAREAALGAASRDVWKEAFSQVGNAGMNAAKRSRDVWQNFDKYRTRVEERGSGTYLIYYKGDRNLPAAGGSKAGVGASNSKASSAGGSAGETREKKTERKSYYLYGTHDVEFELKIQEGGKPALQFEPTKTQANTKLGPCVSESVDGWSATVVSGGCFLTQIRTSPAVENAIRDSLIAHFTANRLPKQLKKIEGLMAKGDSVALAEAMLTGVLYGADVVGKPREALTQELGGFITVPADRTELALDLASVIRLAQVK